jgi:hypothetical protein
MCAHCQELPGHCLGLLGPSKNIPKKVPLNCRSLHGTPGQVGFARDDKGESGCPLNSHC